MRKTPRLWSVPCFPIIVSVRPHALPPALISLRPSCPRRVHFFSSTQSQQQQHSTSTPQKTKKDAIDALSSSYSSSSSSPSSITDDGSEAGSTLRMDRQPSTVNRHRLFVFVRLLVFLSAEPVLFHFLVLLFLLVAGPCSSRLSVPFRESRIMECSTV